MSSYELDCRRPGMVSVWVATFSSIEAAEEYFGIPDEIGVELPPDGFARDLGMADFPAESLAVNFEQVAPRPLWQLLQDATFSESFIRQAVSAANKQGIREAQGIALLYDFAYQVFPERQNATGPLRFIGSFPFVGTAQTSGYNSKQDPRIEIREIMDDVL